MWLNRQTAEPRFLEFRYVGLPQAARSVRDFGGRVAFQRIPGRGWLISQWSVKAPVIATVARRQAGNGGFGSPGQIRTITVSDSVLTHLHEEGGEVLVAREGGRLLWAARLAVLTGRVVDSASRRPLDGGVVGIAGTAYRARLDGEGRFRLDSLVPGANTLVFSGASRGLTAFERRIDVTIPEGSTELELAVPLSSWLGARGNDDARVQESRCTQLREAREVEIRAGFSEPAAGWRPRGRDSLATERAVRGAAVVIQGIADTTGRVPADAARALRRGRHVAYLAALDALAKLQVTVDEPVAGCKLRRLVVMPYRVTGQ
ncbi:MAG: hypothetical protein H0W68_00295 [Gemmatimonadaceae bacterium]|nr:hypothetical protein [Gemmatimonadaceae bacterium]